MLLATKLRLGDSNTVMAEGGIQAAVGEDDSPQLHFEDMLRAGHFCGEPELVAQMVMDGPDVIRWLIRLGMAFDLEDDRSIGGKLLRRKPGGASAARILSYRDYTGLEMRRVLRVLRELDSFQYHPSAIAFPPHLAGGLVSEAARSAGATLVNGEGERFVDELAPRDVVASAILRECAEGRGIERDGQVGVFLDTPTLELQQPGILDQRLVTLRHLARKGGHDPAIEPFLLRPTLHYQNGGVAIDKDVAAWYRALGSGGTAGTKLYSLSGDVLRPGLYELPMGTRLDELVFEHGGGMLQGKQFKAVFHRRPVEHDADAVRARLAPGHWRDDRRLRGHEHRAQGRRVRGFLRPGLVRTVPAMQGRQLSAERGCSTASTPAAACAPTWTRSRTCAASCRAADAAG